MRHASLVVLSLTLAALLQGCSLFSGGPQAAKGSSQDKLDADYAECESMSYVSTAGIRAEGAADERRQELIDACMHNKGYAVQ